MTQISRKNVFFGFAAVLFCAVIIFAVWSHLINLPTGKSDNFEVDIERGMTAGDIAAILQENGLIRSIFYFKFISNFKDYSHSFKAGLHPLDGTMETSEIARRLTLNPPGLPDIKVTIIEGFTLHEIASIFAAKAKIDSAAFTDLAMNSSVAQQLGVDNDTLEGYLYPDTYFVKVNTTPMEMIKRMVDQFARVFNDSLRMRAETLGMTVNEIVTLASIIENETGNDEERPYVSQVFHRRLKLGRPLEANPTIQYAFGSRRRVLKDDLKIDSPYNTYIHPGLPPGPISNPGEKSLFAALYPADSAYLYFVADGKGGNIFSRNLSEHNRAVRLYKHQRKQSSMR